MRVDCRDFSRVVDATVTGNARYIYTVYAMTASQESARFQRQVDRVAGWDRRYRAPLA